MDFRAEITKDFIYNNSSGGNTHFHIKPYVLYEFFTETSTTKKIPNYQRPYSWEKSNVNQFLVDILETMLEKKTKDSWFLGCIYVTKESDSQEVAEILDGQQRLTTLQIIFNELILSQYYDETVKIEQGFLDSINNIKDCLYFKKVGKRYPRFSTDPLTDVLLKKYLAGSLNVNCYSSYKKFQKKFEEELSKTISESKSHKTLYDNINTVRNFLRNKLINPKNYKQYPLLESYDVTERLEFYTNTILYRLWLINIPLVQENISVELFESLNNRGKPLSMIDKFQFQSLTKGFGKDQEIKKSWGKVFKLMDKLHSSAVNISFIASDEDLIKLYFESKFGEEIAKEDYLIKFENDCLDNYNSLEGFFTDIFRISEFFIDISNAETSSFIKGFEPTKKNKKAKAITRVLLSFLNVYKNPIRLVFSLLTKYNYKTENTIVISGIWEILKLSFYKNIIIAEQGNKIRSDFNFYIKSILNKDPSYFISLFYKLYLILESDTSHPFHKLTQSNSSSFQFDNVKFPKPGQGEISYASSLDSKSGLLNTTDNRDSTLVLLFFVLLNDEYESFNSFSASAFKSQNLEHIFPRAYFKHWQTKTYKKEECETYLEKLGNNNFLRSVQNCLESDFELRKYKTQPYLQPQALNEWIGNKLLINELANKKIGNKNYAVKYEKYDTGLYILPSIKNNDLKLVSGENFNYKTIINRSNIIVTKITKSLICNWDYI